jgi:hypothetical protein
MYTLSEFIKFNHDKGLNWFEAETMRFFGTRISNWDCISGLFITSEQPPHSTRMYSVRQALWDTGQVVTLGEFMAYKSLREAKTALKRYSKMSIEDRLAKK